MDGLRVYNSATAAAAAVVMQSGLGDVESTQVDGRTAAVFCHTCPPQCTCVQCIDHN